MAKHDADLNIFEWKVRLEVENVGNYVLFSFYTITNHSTLFKSNIRFLKNKKRLCKNNWFLK